MLTGTGLRMTTNDADTTLATVAKRIKPPRQAKKKEVRQKLSHNNQHEDTRNTRRYQPYQQSQIPAYMTQNYHPQNAFECINPHDNPRIFYIHNHPDRPRLFRENARRGEHERKVEDDSGYQPPPEIRPDNFSLTHDILDKAIKAEMKPTPQLTPTQMEQPVTESKPLAEPFQPYRKPNPKETMTAKTVYIPDEPNQDEINKIEHYHFQKFYYKLFGRLTISMMNRLWQVTQHEAENLKERGIYPPSLRNWKFKMNDRKEVEYPGGRYTNDHLRSKYHHTTDDIDVKHSAAETRPRDVTPAESVDLYRADNPNKYDIKYSFEHYQHYRNKRSQQQTQWEHRYSRTSSIQQKSRNGRDIFEDSFRAPMYRHGQKKSICVSNLTREEAYANQLSHLWKLTIADKSNIITRYPFDKEDYQKQHAVRNEIQREQFRNTFLHLSDAQIETLRHIVQPDYALRFVPWNTKIRFEELYSYSDTLTSPPLRPYSTNTQQRQFENDTPDRDWNIMTQHGTTYPRSIDQNEAIELLHTLTGYITTTIHDQHMLTILARQQDKQRDWLYMNAYKEPELMETLEISQNHKHLEELALVAKNYAESDIDMAHNQHKPLEVTYPWSEYIQLHQSQTWKEHLQIYARRAHIMLRQFWFRNIRRQRILKTNYPNPLGKKYYQFGYKSLFFLRRITEYGHDNTEDINILAYGMARFMEIYHGKDPLIDDE
jgi:hypothetical protein